MEKLPGTQRFPKDRKKIILHRRQQVCSPAMNGLQTCFILLFDQFQTVSFFRTGFVFSRMKQKVRAV